MNTKLSVILGIGIGLSTLNAHAGYLDSVKAVDQYNEAAAFRREQENQIVADRNILRALYAFANAHGGPVAPIQMSGEGAFRTAEFTTKDGYDCALMADYGAVLSCANPYKHTKFTKAFKIR